MEGRSQKVNGQSTVMESPTLITHTHLHRWWMTMSHAASFLLLSYLQTNNSLTRVCNHWLGINWSRQTLGYGIYVTMMFIIQVWTTPWLLNLQLVHVFTWLKPVTVEPILKTPLADNQDNCSIDRVQHYVLFSPEKKLIYLSCTSQVLIVRPLYVYTRKTGCWSVLVSESEGAIWLYCRLHEKMKFHCSIVHFKFAWFSLNVCSTCSAHMTVHHNR